MLNEQEKAEYKVATYLVGFFFFLSVWWIWSALELSVFAVSAAAPKATATSFSLGVIGTNILGPLIVTIGFVMSRAGQLILTFAASLVARMAREPAAEPGSGSQSVSPQKVSAQFRKMDQRVKALEATVAKWETVE